MERSRWGGELAEKYQKLNAERLTEPKIREEQGVVYKRSKGMELKGTEHGRTPQPTNQKKKTKKTPLRTEDKKERGLERGGKGIEKGL